MIKILVSSVVQGRMSLCCKLGDGLHRFTRHFCCSCIRGWAFRPLPPLVIENSVAGSMGVNILGVGCLDHSSGSNWGVSTAFHTTWPSVCQSRAQVGVAWPQRDSASFSWAVFPVLRLQCPAYSEPLASQRTRPPTLDQFPCPAATFDRVYR